MREAACWRESSSGLRELVAAAEVAVRRPMPYSLIKTPERLRAP